LYKLARQDRRRASRNDFVLGPSYPIPLVLPLLVLPGRPRCSRARASLASSSLLPPQPPPRTHITSLHPPLIEQSTPVSRVGVSNINSLAALINSSWFSFLASACCPLPAAHCVPMSLSGKRRQSLPAFGTHTKTAPHPSSPPCCLSPTTNHLSQLCCITLRCCHCPPVAKPGPQLVLSLPSS
jgi:hypothetical protein